MKLKVLTFYGVNIWVVYKLCFDSSAVNAFKSTEQPEQDNGGIYNDIVNVW